MSKAGPIARILLGIIFAAAGASGFYLATLATLPPAPPGLASDFQVVFFRSHWVLIVDFVELACGVLLLANRYVPLALVALAAVIVNIYAFHLTMALPGVVAPIVVTALWLLVALPLRSHFAPLLVARTGPQRARDAANGGTSPRSATAGPAVS